jgi:tetratricopeptide (TPR) repeat protein
MSILLEALRQKGRSEGLASSVDAANSQVKSSQPASIYQSAPIDTYDSSTIDTSGLTLEDALRPLNIQTPENVSWQLASNHDFSNLHHGDDETLDLLFPQVETEDALVVGGQDNNDLSFDYVIDNGQNALFNSDKSLTQEQTAQGYRSMASESEYLASTQSQPVDTVSDIIRANLAATKSVADHEIPVNSIDLNFVTGGTHRSTTLTQEQIIPEVTLSEVKQVSHNAEAAGRYVNLVDKQSFKSSTPVTKKLTFDRKVVNPILLGGFVALSFTALLGYYGWQVWQDEQQSLSSQLARYEAPVQSPLPTVALSPNSSPYSSLASEQSELMVAPIKANVTDKKRQSSKQQVALDPTPMPTPNPLPVPLTVHKSLSISSLLNNAWNSWHEGDVVAAERDYRSVLEKQPSNRDALIGMLVVTQSQPSTQARAEEIAMRLNELYPNDEEVSALTANVQGTTAKNSESKLKNQIQKEPNNASSFYQLGIFYANEKRWSEAQSVFFKAVTLDPGQPEYLANLAISYDQLGKAGLAADMYQRALDSARIRPSTLNQDALLVRLQYLLSAQKTTEDELL